MSESLAYDNLIAGDMRKLVTEPGTIVVGQVFSRGAILGRLSANEEWRPIDETETGSVDHYGIATEAIDSTAGNVVTSIFVEGEFSQNGVVLAYGDTIADWLPPTTAGLALETQGIYLRKTVSVLGQ